MISTLLANKEFVHALRAYIESWMHAGSLESTKNA